MTREEAIKEMKKKLPWLTEDTKRLVEALIPEFKESEDERIRKELVAFFKEMRDTWHEIYWHDLQVEGILAWLEKQKEKMTAEEYEKTELFQLKLKTKYANGYQDGLAQKEQKQPLSERFRPDFPAVADFVDSVDDMEKSRAIGILEDYLKWAVSSEEECRYTWKELADAIQLGIDAMKEPKPAEWSEEDENMLWNVISIVGESKSIQADEMLDWLKSLRPSWKPSEEQMKVDCDELEDAAKEYSERVSGGHYRDLTCAFIAGAEWMAEKD